jgi:hypothetical protein
MTRYFKTDLIKYFLLIFVSIFVSLQSPLAPFAKGIPWTDSSVFIYTAKSIMNGAVLYRDVFDHKGPFLYLINITGLFISGGTGFWGIWLLQLFSLLTTALFLYKTSLLFFNKYISSIIVSVLLVFQSCLDVGGNIAESWSVPLMSVALYIFAQYFISKKQLSWIQVFALSTTFTSTFLLRPNLVLIWGVFGLAIILDLICTKRFADIGRYSLLVIGFTIITIIPYFLYFHFNNTVKDALYGILWFNFKYTSGLDMEAIKLTLLGFFRYVFVIVPIILFSIISVLKYDRQNIGLFNLAVTTSILLTILSCCVGRPSMHYFTQIIPLLIIPLGYCLSYLYDNLLQKKVLITSIIVFSFTSAIIFFSTKSLLKNYLAHSTATFDESVIDVIKNNTVKDDKILVIGNSTNYYLFSDRMSSSKYPFSYPIIEKDKNIEDEYCKELVSKKPKLIVVDFFWEVLDSRVKQRIERILDEYYTRIDSKINNLNIWIRNDCCFVE